MQKQVTIDGIAFTVHQATGRHRLLKTQLYARVNDPAAENNDVEFTLWFDFINCFVQSSDVSGLPFEWPAYTLNVEQLRPVRDAWLSLPEHVYVEWTKALEDVEPKSDPDLAPPGQLEKKDETTPEQSQNDQSLETLSLVTS